MDRFTSEDFSTRPARYEGFDTSDEAGDDGPSLHQLAVRAGRLLACGPEAECESCGSVRKTVQGDREIRRGAVCCEGQVA